MMTLEAMLCRRAKRQAWLAHLAVIDKAVIEPEPKRGPGRPAIPLDDNEIRRATKILDGGGSYATAAKAIGRSRYAVEKALPGRTKSQGRARTEDQRVSSS